MAKIQFNLCPKCGKQVEMLATVCCHCGSSLATKVLGQGVELKFDPGKRDPKIEEYLRQFEKAMTKAVFDPGPNPFKGRGPYNPADASFPDFPYVDCDTGTPVPKPNFDDHIEVVECGGCGRNFEVVKGAPLPHNCPECNPNVPKVEIPMDPPKPIPPKEPPPTVIDRLLIVDDGAVIKDTHVLRPGHPTLTNVKYNKIIVWDEPVGHEDWLQNIEDNCLVEGGEIYYLW